MPLPNVVGRQRRRAAIHADGILAYADDLFADQALEFVSNHQHEPFFLYWSLVTPHANNERNQALKDGAHVPTTAPMPERMQLTRSNTAAITRLDSYVGRLLDHLELLDLDRKTLVLFTSDNGPHNESSHTWPSSIPRAPSAASSTQSTDDIESR